MTAGVLRGCAGHNGYLICTLFSDDDSKLTRKIHRLVCRAFHGSQPTPSHQVRHLDGNKLNNRADNLAWGTPLENAADRSQRHGTQVRGERVKRAKLTTEQVRYIRACGASNKALGEEFGMNQNSIGAIRAGKSWRHVA
jgi:hypothetical protein